jgi:MFS family permease
MAALKAVCLPLAGPRAESGRRTMAVVFAGFCAFLGLYATQPLLPLLEQVFHAGKVGVSLTVTAATAGVALAAPAIGSIADRFGRKRVIVLSATLLALATLLAATATTLNMLVFWRFLQGMFTPGVFAVTVAYIQEEWGERTGSAMAAYVTGTVIGGFTGRMTTGLVASHANWRWSFVALGLTGALGAAALAGFLPRERRFGGRTGAGSFVSAARDHLRNRALVATYAAGFCVLFSLLGAFTYVTFYLAAPPFRLSPAALASLFFVYLVGAAVTPPCGRAIDRYGRRNAMAAAMGVAALGILLTLSHSLWLVAAGLAVVCSGVFVAQSAANSYIGVAARRDKALAVGLYVTFYYVGGSAGAALPGYVWALGGWPACVALFALVQLSTVAIALALISPDSRPADRIPALPHPDPVAFE